MFSGRHSICSKNDAKVFIDRDPEAFKLMIDFLRNNGQTDEQMKQDDKRILNGELSYWEINKSHFKSAKPSKDKYDVIQEILDRPFNDLLDLDDRMSFFNEAIE